MKLYIDMLYYMLSVISHLFSIFYSIGNFIFVKGNEFGIRFQIMLFLNSSHFSIRHSYSLRRLE